MSLELEPNDLTALATNAEDAELDKTKTEAPAEVSSGNYPTGFCTSPESCQSRANEIIGFLFIALFIYYCVMYFPLFLPYMKGILKMVKYFVLYGLIMSTILLFIHVLGYLFWWLILFHWAVERMIDPLKDNTVSSWYYYLTDNVNWIVYYPSMVYFFICMIGLIILLVLMILPAVSVIGFLIGYLFSLMGEAPCDKPKSTVLGRIVSGTIASVPGLSKVFSKAPSVMGKPPSLTPSVMGKPPALASSIAPMMGKPPALAPRTI